MSSPSHRSTDTSEPRFSMESFDMGSLGPLDDLISLGSHEMSSPSAARVTLPYSNAVHMEIQENAKLPTFNLPVDRSNSTRKLEPSTSHDLDEMVRLTEKDFNLTEMFLTSHERSSMNLNWSCAGALLTSELDGDDSTARSGSAPTPSISGIQPPVPLSVHVPATVGTHPGQRSPTKAATSPTKADLPAAPTLGTALATSPDAATSTTTTTTHQETLPHYPYHRSLPLPIPKRLSPVLSPDEDSKPAATDDAMTAAVATAAAIVSQQPPAPSSLHMPALPTNGKHPSMSPPPPPDAAKSTATASLKTSPHNPRASYPTTAPSLMEATKRRNQFGFGESHVVPSVPLPPTKRQYRKKHVPATAPPPVKNGGEAYERKKQRAKDARVKLNDAIERLAIAVSLSGTQATQRATQISAVTLPGVRGQELSQNFVAMLRDCNKISADAKKWDRPAFVGTAADLIQSLNAQCEALMTIMLDYNRHFQNGNGAQQNVGDIQQQTLSRVSPSPQQMECSVEGDTATSLGAKRKALPLDVTLPDLKRARVDGENTVMNGQVVEHDPESSGATIDSILCKESVVKCVLAMLDPRSIVRCGLVSKKWNNTSTTSSYCGNVWLDRCLQRFGPDSVRQWKEKLENSTTPFKLYKEMDTVNVKPYCRQDASIILGEARMAGKVSAWAYMMERSNGETYRSVTREPGGPSDRAYTSLPVVELRLLIQNTGFSEGPIVIKEQTITVDASTRRRGEEMKEISWDNRFRKVVLNLDGTPRADVVRRDSHDVVGELCRLNLFEAAILVVHIHARGCSTTCKFQAKSNFSKVLVTLNGTTVPLVIPFFRESSSLS